MMPFGRVLCRGTALGTDTKRFICAFDLFSSLRGQSNPGIIPHLLHRGRFSREMGTGIFTGNSTELDSYSRKHRKVVRGNASRASLKSWRSPGLHGVSGLTTAGAGGKTTFTHHRVGTLIMEALRLDWLHAQVLGQCAWLLHLSSTSPAWSTKVTGRSPSSGHTFYQPGFELLFLW